MTGMIDQTARAELLRRRLSGRWNPPAPDGIRPVDRDGPLAVSPVQRALWILDRMRPGGLEYLMTTAVRLRGHLDPSALRVALDGVVGNHEVLRTRYQVVDGEPTQVIDAPAPVDLAEIDLGDLDPAARERTLADLLTTGRRPVDLARDPVLRATLVRLADTEHALALTVHHIAADGWSEGLILRELFARYDAALAGEPMPYPVPGLRYADYASWRRDQSVGVSLDYWRGRLAGLTPTELPTDRPRPVVPDPAGDLVTFTVPAPVVAALTDVARVGAATPFQALLTAFTVLLARYTGHTDVAVGTPAAGRDRPETQRMVGAFVNTLVLRTDLSGDPEFTEALRRVRDATLDGYGHQDVPYELLIDDLAADRGTRAPLYTTMFLWQAATGDLAATGLTVEPIQVGETTAKCDLTLSLAERSDGALAGAVNYATALFDRDTAARFAGHFTRMVTGIAAAPRSRVSALDPLTDAERRQVVQEWNDTAVAYPPATLPDLFADQVARAPDAEAVRCAGTALSYAELNARANRLAHDLIGLGVGPESVVGVCLARGVDLVVALLGVLKAGGAYLPLDPDLPAERLRYMIADSGADVVVTGRDQTIQDATGITVVDVSADRCGVPDTDPDPGLAPDNAAYVIYTSGSTGRPKGVVVEHLGIVNRIRWAQDTYRLDATDRVAQKTPYGFDVSVWEFFWPLVSGATIVVARPGGHRDPAYLLDLVRTERITTIHFVPSMLRAFLAEPFDALPSLRRVLCSGEALTGDLVAAVHQRTGLRPHNLYGPTEASVDVTATRCEPGQPVTIGRPVANTRTYLVDRDLNPVPVGVPGELLLAGVQLARGYLGRPDLTAERFVPDPFAAEPGQRLYRTGDLARYRPDGAIEYLGRLDRQVKIGGHRVELGEIESVLAWHPDVAAAAVTAHDERLVAYLTPGSVDPGAVRRYLRDRLPEQMVPARWVTLDALPLTTNGKVDRAALPAPTGARSPLVGEYVPPRTSTERAIAEVMASALGVEAVGAHDSFFQLGGDSMRAIRAVGALRADGFDLAVHDLFTHQTVAELAEVVDRADPSAPDRTLVEPFAMVAEADRPSLPDGLVDAYPMARTQAGMVYEMLAADRPVYQNVSCYRVRDDVPFDLDALRAAGELLVGRHEILRTSFDLSTYSESMQLVSRHAELPIGFDDLSGLTAATQRSIVDQFLVSERGRPIDISRPPLVRYHAHKISDEEWWLTHSECHAILDGWSHTSVVAELIATYRAIRRGARPDLPSPPPVRFADFVAAERAAERSPEDREYWAGVVLGNERFELPASWGDAVQDERPTIVDVPYTDLYPRLLELASAANASMKSVLHAAHLKALSIVSGRDRFTSGVVCNGRPEWARGDEVRGMYLNTVPFAADVTAPSWRGLVASAFAGEADLWPHRRYPMPTMRREWGDAGPLIEVAFGYLDFHVLDWAAESVGMVDDFSPSELPLEVWTFPGVLRLGGRPSRVRRDRLELLARVYRHVLEAMAADPDADPRSLGLPPADAEDAVRVGNDTASPVPADRLVHHLVDDAARSTPDAVALRCGGSTVDYATLNRRADRLAARLRSLGVGRDTIVGLYLPRGVDLVVSSLAVLKAGGAFLPLDPDYPADRVRYMLTDAGVGVVLTTRGLRDSVPPGPGVRVETVDGGQEGGRPVEFPNVTAAPDDLAYVIYTSGSTGRPKGVAVPHRGAVNLRYAQREHLDIRPGDRVLNFASPSFDASVWEMLMALTNGAELVLPPPGTDVSDLRAQAEVVTHMTVPPSVLDRLSPEDFPCLRVVVSAGEACTGEQAARWARHTRFINAYGPTETSVCATLTEVPVTADTPAPSIGLPVANVQVYVLDAAMRPLPAGVRGELYIGGAGVARGYLNRPSLTAERFVPDPFGGRPGARLYRSGDMVSRNADGTIQYHGRDDDQVKVRGVRIELGEIENALASHPAVAGAVLTVHAGGTRDATLVAYTTPVPGVDAPAPGDLREHARRRLPSHLVPTHYLTVDAFPLTPAGKIDRAALPAPTSGRPATAAPYTPPRTETERAIAEALARALGVDRVGAHDDFFDLGGHSLAMMRAIATLRATHGLVLRFRSFTEHRTVAELAATVGDSSDPVPTTAMTWVRREGTDTPLVCVHPGGGSAHWYLRLVPHLDPDLPVIGFSWPGPHPEGVPSAEAMAERYLTELREVQPRGPYRLLSWCGGSGIATEMARRLLDAGDEVTFMLLDPGVDAHTRDGGWQELALIRRLENLLVEVVEGGAAADTAQRRQEILDLLDHLVDDVDENGITLPEQGVGDVWPRSVRIWREVMEMDMTYRHTPVAGVLHLIVSDELAAGDHEVADGQTFADYLDRWRELVTDGVHTHRVPGDHFGVMKPPHVSVLGALVTRLLASPGAERSR